MRLLGFFGSVFVFASCVSCLGCLTMAGTSLSSAANPIDKRADQSLKPAETEEAPKKSADDTVRASTCFAGVVSSSGPLGHPLEGIEVKVTDPPDSQPPTKTDEKGRFHVCLPRESMGVAGVILTGGPRFKDRKEHLHLVFSGAGLAKKELDVDVSTADKKRSLDVALDPR